MRHKLEILVVLTAATTLSMQSLATATGSDLGGGGAEPVAAVRVSPPAVAKADAAAVVIGQTDTAPSTCGPAVTLTQGGISGGNSYVVPGAGVITSYSHAANANPGSVRLTMFTPGPAAGHWTLVGKSALNPVTVSTLNTFPVRVPVPAGATLGIQISSGAMDCVANGVTAADVVSFSSVFNADTQTDMTATNQAGLRVNASAVWEPDADQDGFGDVSQDQCPQSASTQAACPTADTVLKKAPKKKSTKRQVKIKFTSSPPGSTFRCAVDSNVFAACTSPLKKRFKYGKHEVVIAAVNIAGLADPTPLKVKFKIIRPS